MRRRAVPAVVERRHISRDQFPLAPGHGARPAQQHLGQLAQRAGRFRPVTQQAADPRICGVQGDVWHACSSRAPGRPGIACSIGVRKASSQQSALGRPGNLRRQARHRQERSRSIRTGTDRRHTRTRRPALPMRASCKPGTRLLTLKGNIVEGWPWHNYLWG
jgi:hypothetical protein